MHRAGMLLGVLFLAALFDAGHAPGGPTTPDHVEPIVDGTSDDAPTDDGRNRGAASSGALFTEAEIVFEPGPSEADVPELFRMSANHFLARREPVETVSKSFTISNVTFPSPVVTPHEVNNTVHCEYFAPRREGSRPGVVVLHILGGDFELSRLFCRYLADQGAAALFVKMPYYGPRRPADAPARMVSLDPRETVAGMRQAVLDIRRAVAWLAAQPEVDPERLGIFGISLGGITAALAATAEPRLHNVCLMLAGGDVGRIGWNAPHMEEIRTSWLASGGTQQSFLELFATIDPVTYAHRARDRRILMLNARHDELVPEACTLALWEAFGRPEIEWMDAGHYSAMRFIFDGLADVTRFFTVEPTAP